MKRTRIKICGITQVSDLTLIARLGADAAGVVFAPRSARALSINHALTLRDNWPPLMSLVALFVNPKHEQVEEVISALRPELLQFHGNESADFCASFDRPYIKAIKATEMVKSLSDIRAYHDSAAALLIDTHIGDAGGSGQSFNWDNWADMAIEMPLPWLLAGGLTPANVGEGIGKLRPYGVDVSTGVERTSGVKDPALLRQFVGAVQQADGKIYEETV